MKTYEKLIDEINNGSYEHGAIVINYKHIGLQNILEKYKYVFDTYDDIVSDSYLESMDVLKKKMGIIVSRHNSERANKLANAINKLVGIEDEN